MKVQITTEVKDYQTLKNLKSLIGSNILGLEILSVEDITSDETQQQQEEDEIINKTPNYERMNQYPEPINDLKDITGKVISRLEKNDKLKNTIMKHGLSLLIENTYNKVISITSGPVGDIEKPEGVSDDYIVYTINLEKPLLNTNGNSLAYVLKFWNLFGIPVIQYENSTPLFGKAYKIPITALKEQGIIRIFSPYEYETKTSSTAMDYVNNLLNDSDSTIKAINAVLHGSVQ